MQVKVILDKNGEIISTTYQPRSVPEDYDKVIPHMGPVVDDGQTLVELGVPDEYESYPVSEFIERVTVDVQANLAKIKVKKK